MAMFLFFTWFERGVQSELELTRRQGQVRVAGLLCGGVR